MFEAFRRNEKIYYLQSEGAYGPRKKSKVCYAVNWTILREDRGGGSIANHSGA